MDKSELDFRMLLVFQTLMDTRQVSAAADRLGFGQSNVSRALAKLRQHFGDPLFVRTQRGMEPTPKAVQLAKSVQEMLNLYESSLKEGSTFDPATSHRVFQIAASDIGHVLILSSLSRTIFAHAPMVQLHGVPLGVNTLAKQLETSTDIAFGPFPKLYAGIHERKVFVEQYACLVRRDHPTISGSISLDQFRNSQHITVSTHRLGHVHEEIQTEILKYIPRSNQRIVVENFTAAALLAESTDFIVTLPSRMVCERHFELQVLPLPFELPVFEVKLYWHERFHHDPAHIWLRNLIYDSFSGPDTGNAPVDSGTVSSAQ